VTPRVQVSERLFGGRLAWAPAPRPCKGLAPGQAVILRPLTFFASDQGIEAKYLQNKRFFSLVLRWRCGGGASINGWFKGRDGSGPATLRMTEVPPPHRTEIDL
jgi:hypothetical protein